MPSKKVVKKPTEKVPRSQIIDRELLRYKKGEEVDWNAIASKVIQAKAAPEDKRTSIINQAKTRFKWYTVEGKKNPAAAPAPKESQGQ